MAVNNAQVVINNGAIQTVISTIFPVITMGISASLTGATAGGDLSGTFPNPTVIKLNGTLLSGLGTGLLKNTTGTGIPSIAASGTDYAPATSGNSILYGNGAGGFSNVTVGANLTFSGGTLAGVAGASPAGATNELQKNGGSGAFSGTGVYSVSNGDLLAGTSLAGSVRQITADGSAADVSMRIQSKGAGAVQLYSNGEVILGSNSTVNMSLLVQASSYQSGQGIIFIHDANAIPSGNPTAGAFLYSQSGLLKYRSSGGTIYPVGFINSANANEIIKSDGTNAVSSGFYSTNFGDLILGAPLSGGTSRVFTSAGNSSDIDIWFSPKGNGSVVAVTPLVKINGSSTNTNTVLYPLNVINLTSASTSSGIGVGISFTNKNGAGNYISASSIESILSTVTGGSESSDLIFRNYQNGASSEKWRMVSTGVLRNSATTLAAADVSIGALKVYFPTSDTSVFHVAGFFQAEQTAATTFSIQGLEGYTKVSATGTTTLAIGTIGNFELSSTGTVSLARSLQAGGNLTAAGTVVEWSGLYVNFANSGGATVTTGIGVQVDTFPSGVTTKYSIKTNDTSATNYFSGKIQTNGLPTSASGLPSGSLWNNAGVINIV